MRATNRLDWGLFCAAGVLASLALAVGLAEIGWVWAGVIWCAAALAGAIAVWLQQTLRRAAAASEVAAARLAEQLHGQLGSAASSAVDLAARLERSARQARPGPEESFSHDLAEWHIHRTAAELHDLDLAALYRQHHRRQRNTAYGALAAAIVVAGGSLWGLDTGRERLAAFLLSPNAVRLAQAPLAGDIQLTYHYPAYTKKESRVVEGGDGSISAVAGTEVALRAIADRPVREAWLKVTDANAATPRKIHMEVSGERQIQARFPVLRDGRYHFVLVTTEGERLEESRDHSIRALVDAYPEIKMTAPQGDVEVRDNETVRVGWRARDDYGVAEVSLVVEPPQSETRRIPLARSEATAKRRGDTYRWSVVDLGLPEGTEARFYLEAVDNDAISGPKKSVSRSRRLSIFSARKHHEKLLRRQKEAMNALVDLLAAELTAELPSRAAGAQAAARAIEDEKQGLRQMEAASTLVQEVATGLQQDELAKPGVVQSFSNIAERVGQARRKRGALLGRAERSEAPAAVFGPLRRHHAKVSKTLENDVLYLDDLLATQRIGNWKRTAKELLTAQRDLQGLLDEYRQTQDPELKAQLERRIKDLKNRMLELMAKMSQIKEKLPGEYRNMEAAQQLELGDRMRRLEDMLRQGDVEQAAKQLEQVANMLEGMMDQMDNAQRKYGDERYAEVREKLSDFSQKFEQLESEQNALAERTEDMLDSYRKRAVKNAAGNLDKLVERARAETGKALSELDSVARQDSLYGIDRRLSEARQRLLDLDSLLQQKDFAEARDVAQQAVQSAKSLHFLLESRVGRYRADNAPDVADAAKAGESAKEHSKNVKDLLDQLFPEPQDVLDEREMAKLEGMQAKQGNLQQQAEKLGEKMEDLAEKLPLFGGKPKQSLESARQEMGRASQQIGRGGLPRAARHGRRAAEELGKLRKSLEQAAQGQQGGMPLPLGAGGGRGGAGRNGNVSQEDVEIPDDERQNRGERFREALMEAAKQKAPDAYEEAVRRYYEELIR